MKYSYRLTRANKVTRRAENFRLEVETDGWREHIRNVKSSYYSNTADIIDEVVWPLVEAEKPNELCGALVHYYLQWKKTSPSIIFEFAMYVWREFQAGRVSADVWAATLAAAWQSGERGMMACVVMSPALVVKMFKSAPLKTLHDAAKFDDDDLHGRYESLPEACTVYRGVSTGINNHEDGFSWTTDQEQAATFSILNCQTKKEIPGVISALVPREAVLALFSFENEVVVDPTVPKLAVEKSFLRGSELRQFHRKFNVAKAQSSILMGG
ncbi:hypothetical protein [Hydrogenophaga sp.]|uniref:hypothetical protein n=1 Tax=Hydrogenophaga sp. TaxID=1904254 RepID=UPI003D26D7BA